MHVVHTKPIKLNVYNLCKQFGAKTSKDLSLIFQKPVTYFEDFVSGI